MELYNEACAAYANEASSRRHGKSTAAPIEEEYIEEEDDDNDDNGDDGDHEDDEDYEDE
jgi:hypothetical protein